MLESNKLKFAIFFISALFAASCFSKTLTVYYCNTFSDAEACSANCSKTEKGITYDPKYEQKLEFLISKESKSVMVKTYFGGRFSASRIMKNCTIFDENNWDCSDEPFWVEEAKWYAHIEEKMHNGFYVQGVYNSKNTKFKSKIGVCAK